MKIKHNQKVVCGKAACKVLWVFGQATAPFYSTVIGFILSNILRMVLRWKNGVNVVRKKNENHSVLIYRLDLILFNFTEKSLNAISV